MSSDNKELKPKRFTFGFILLAIIISIIIILFVVGYFAVIKQTYLSVSFWQSFTQEVFARKNYTFIGTLTDFDRQLGDLRYDILTAAFISGIALLYSIKVKEYKNLGNHSQENKIETLKKNEYHGKRKVIVLLIIAIIYTIFLVIASYLNIGWSFIELNGRNIFIYDYYPQYFSTQLVSLAYLFLGGGFFYILIRRHFRSQFYSYSFGKWLILFSFILFNVMLIGYPLSINFIITNEAIWSLLGMLLNVTLSTAVILIIQSKIAEYQSQKSQKHQLIESSKGKKALFFTFFGGLALWILFIVAISIIQPFTSLGPGFMLLTLPSAAETALFTALFYIAGITWGKGINKKAENENKSSNNNKGEKNEI